MLMCINQYKYNYMTLLYIDEYFYIVLLIYFHWIGFIV